MSDEGKWYAQKTVVIFTKNSLSYLFILFVKMAVKACEVGDQVKCKTNVNKTGVVTSIEREKGSKTKVYHVKWDSAQCSILVPRLQFVLLHNPAKQIMITEMEENASKFRESGTLIIEQIYNSEFQRDNKKTSEEKNVAESKFQDKVNLKAEKIRQKIASAEKLIASKQIENEEIIDETSEVESYKPINTANAIYVTYKQSNHPVYADYSRRHCWEIV
jgi:hypothetical protein